MITRIIRRASEWAQQRLSGPWLNDSAPEVCAPPFAPRRLVMPCVLIFIAALGVRLLHWQDCYVETLRSDSLSAGLTKSYQHEAERMTEDGSVLFPNPAVDPGDAHILIHPPGYSILLLVIHKLHGDPTFTMRALQVVCDSAAAVLVFLITVEFLPIVVGIIAGVLAAVSPHLAYYSLWLTADSLVVLPILLAVLLIVRSLRRPRLWVVILAGVCLGISCWLRSNVLLLVLFIAMGIGLTFPRGHRVRCAVMLVVITAVVIAPITIRNWVVFKSFIPLSLGVGITMIEGIADYDVEGQFGMPRDDNLTALKDAEWYGRADYANNLWSPDGVARDRTRMARGLAVVRSHPVWFLGVMLQRAGFMLRYDDGGTHRWPFDTANVAIVSAEPSYGHQVELTNDMAPVWSSTPTEMATDGGTLSPEARVSVTSDGSIIELAGDQQLYGDEFATGPIEVQKNHDYMLLIPAYVEREPVAAKVMSADRRIGLAAAEVPNEDQPSRKKKRPGEDTHALATQMAGFNMLRLPFASGNRTEVRLVFSNNGASSATAMRAGQANLYDLGATPYVWSHYPRVLIRVVQKNVFVTKYLLPLIGLGLGFLALARNGHALILLLALPTYYLLIHSLLHVEYRYILPIHYFLFVFAATALYCLFSAISEGIVSITKIDMKKASSKFFASRESR